MPYPHTCLYHQPPNRGDVLPGALDLVKVPMVAIVGLNSLVLLEKSGKDGGKNLFGGPLSSGVRTLNLDRSPPQMSTTPSL